MVYILIHTLLFVVCTYLCTWDSCNDPFAISTRPVLSSEDDTSQFDSNFTKQTPVDSPCGASLSESVNLVFQASVPHVGMVSVSDPDSFFTDPDPGSRQQKTNFFEGKNKIWGKFFVFNPKSTVGILFLFTTNQVGILLNRELLFGIIFKSKWKSWKICGKSGFL